MAFAADGRGGDGCPRHADANPSGGAASHGVGLPRHPRASQSIELGGHIIAFELRRSARRSLALHVGPQGLSVRAPHGLPWPEIEAFLHRKAAWIVRHLQRHGQRVAPAWPEPTPALLAQARVVLAARVAHFAPLLGVQPRALRLSSARTRWGSASSRGTIALNWRLAFVPAPLADYVVVHELAHLREMHHGPAFWALVAQVLPDYAERRAALRRIALV
ncbi:M48 family metallopeptidase [Tepidimonas charontis]|nr:SprT family zinc-dependent metalloprotease [Tepidimonas charontis]